MAVEAIVLVQTEPGLVKCVCEALRGLATQTSRITDLDTVLGEFDIIIRIQAEDLDALGAFVVRDLHSIAGLARTITCAVAASGASCVSWTRPPARTRAGWRACSWRMALTGVGVGLYDALKGGLRLTRKPTSEGESQKWKANEKE